MLRSKLVSIVLAAAAVAFASQAIAQVPPGLAPQIRALGRVVEPAGTARIYGPLQRKPPYDGVRFVRDLKYGAAPLETLDVAAPSHASRRPRTVVVFVHGGAYIGGDKAVNAKGELQPFYDNIVLWAVGQDMVGVNLNYPLARGATYPTVQKDIGAAIAWVRKNIRRYGGDPDRVFIWGHSAGATHVASYVSHPEFYPGGKPGVRGAIFSSGVYDLAANGGDKPHVYFGAPGGFAERSSVSGLVKTKVALFVSVAELDPPAMVKEAEGLNAALCAAGHCPAHFAVLKDHSHMSESYHVNTADQSLTGPLLDFIKTH
jgi:triacylglycerol lipase